MLLYRLKRYINTKTKTSDWNCQFTLVTDTNTLCKFINCIMIALFSCEEWSDRSLYGKNYKFIICRGNNVQYITRAKNCGAHQWTYTYGKLVKSARRMGVEYLFIKESEMYLVKKREFILRNSWQNIPHSKIRDRYINDIHLKNEEVGFSVVECRYISDLLMIKNFSTQDISILCENWNNNIIAINTYLTSGNNYSNNRDPRIINIGKPINLVEIAQCKNVTENRVVKQWLIIEENRLLRKIIGKLIRQNGLKNSKY